MISILKTSLLFFAALVIGTGTTLLAKEEATEEAEGPNLVATIVIPESVNSAATNRIIQRAALGREWTIVSKTPNSVVINLIHRGYNATLTFKHDSNHITVYSDSYQTLKRLGRETVRKTDPDGWISNLEKDIKTLIHREQSL